MHFLYSIYSFRFLYLLLPIIRPNISSFILQDIRFHISYHLASIDLHRNILFPKTFSFHISLHHTACLYTSPSFFRALTLSLLSNILICTVSSDIVIYQHNARYHNIKSVPTTPHVYMPKYVLRSVKDK